MRHIFIISSFEAFVERAGTKNLAEILSERDTIAQVMQGGTENPPLVLAYLLQRWFIMSSLHCPSFGVIVWKTAETKVAMKSFEREAGTAKGGWFFFLGGGAGGSGGELPPPPTYHEPVKGAMSLETLNSF